MNLSVVAAGVLVGLGFFLVLRELLPAGARLDAALARLATIRDESAQRPTVYHPTSRDRLGRWMRVVAPWLPVPVADLALLGQEPESWLVSKIICGLVGLALPSLLSGLAVVVGVSLPWSIPVVVGIALGVVFFFAPDLVTRVNAAEKRADFRYALSSYLDLVGLERGAGAGPTEALEAAALIGGGWAFERIAMALDAARGLGRPPWAGLADLAGEMGVEELASLADIAGVAGEEGGRVMDTLSALAASMHGEALANTRAKAGSRSTTMVVPIALLAAGFLLLLAFPVLYRSFHGGA
jgi:Type II secretion system (T2SS), protein F